MENTVPHYMPMIDPVMLLPLVRQATGVETIEVTDWQYHELQGGTQGGVYRVSGPARNTMASLPWSLILKIPTTTPNLGDPFGGTREPVVYRSGFLRQLPGMLRAPRCFGVVEQADGGHWIWLEDVRDDSPPHWSLPQYGRTAFLLWQFNGAFLVGQPLPSWPWVATKLIVQDFMDAFLPPRDQFLAAVDYGCAHYDLSPHAATHLAQIYAERQWYLYALDQLPQTLCHGDADSRNFLMRRLADGQEEVVAIDWAWVGRGAVGQDVGRLVNNAVIRGQIAPADLEVLEEIVFTNYLHGLQDAGWQGDSRLVRYGYAASMVLAESLVVLGTTFGALMEPRYHALLMQVFVGSIDDILARMQPLLAYHVRLAQEVRASGATLS